MNGTIKRGRRQFNVTLLIKELKQQTTATATKESLENKHLGNGACIVIITFSLHPLFLTEQAANTLVEAPLK